MRRESRRVKIEDIAKYYDQFVSRQQVLAFNERHFFLYQMLRKQGLRNNSRVLEFGCGIGIITALMARSVKAGRILAVDISPAAVELAKRAVRGASATIDIVVGDLVKFRADGEAFDFITLFDVLEHVPLAWHGEVFRTISAHASRDTTVMINIPNPAYNEYLRQHEPQSLQIVDEALTADHITGCAYANGLALSYFSTYGLWYESEYQVMTFQPQRPYEKRPVRQSRADRVRDRARRLWQIAVRQRS
jgi:2-polyprenyl-3-methyl-5-hydroxy-6-metoxy-1,4-benzoquinol methylase